MLFTSYSHGNSLPLFASRCYFLPALKREDFHYELPPELIAQHPLKERDSSRLLVLDRVNESIRHYNFADLPAFLQEGDLLVLNNSKVIPARFRAVKPGSGGHVEILLVEELETNDWWTMLKPGKRVRTG